MSDTTLRYPGAYVAQFGYKPAVVMFESGASMCYAELDAYANRLARLFRSLGLQPGAHVAFCVENRLECPALLWGAHYAGLYYTFISTRLTAGETLYIVQDCDASALIVSDLTLGPLASCLDRIGPGVKVYTLDRSRPGVESLHEAMASFEASPLEGALEGSEMLYSSGTTGRPKGIKPQLTGKPLGSTAIVADLMQHAFGVGSDSVYLSPAPFYHAGPLKWVQGTQALGGSVVMMEKFDAENALKAIERYKITHSQWVPTMFHRLLGLPEGVRHRYDLSSHRAAVHAAAPCPIPTKLAMIDWWGPIVYEYYSCTEGIGMTFVNSADWLKHPGTVGRALYGKIHILDEEGKELPTGEEGLVYFSGTRPFSYHKDPDKTREAYTVDGWATVGDIGKLDEEGFLYLTDRKNNMIISGGVNVYPQETENVLITHAKVFDVAVIGTPHPDLGEEVRAVVQLQPGVKPGPEVAEELIAWCRKQLSPIKCPRKIDFRESLPREPNGKLLKRLLRDEYRTQQTR
ncbi:MAG: acyl-CoA synthetase [Sinobacteraceae bacterium]|nr:acyl-CoA synthetase [Nevskiaceae bacterium]